MADDRRKNLAGSSLSASDGQINHGDAFTEPGTSGQPDKTVTDSSEVLHRLSELVAAFDHLSGSSLVEETATKKLELPSKS